MSCKCGADERNRKALFELERMLGAQVLDFPRLISILRGRKR